MADVELVVLGMFLLSIGFTTGFAVAGWAERGKTDLENILLRSQCAALGTENEILKSKVMRLEKELADLHT